MANQYKYTYGRKVTEDKYLAEILSLPATSDNKPDWDFMKRYVKSLNHKPLTTSNRGGTALPILGVERWKEFCIGDFFEVRKGKRLTSEDQTEGTTAYIGAIDSNNGVSAYIANNEHLHDPNTITVSYNGSIAETFYQEKPFWATDDVNVLYSRFTMNRYRAMFLCAVIGREKYRFSYGRKWDKDLMIESKIRLPATPDGMPDWDWMENYIKGLPYSAAL